MQRVGVFHAATCNVFSSDAVVWRCTLVFTLISRLGVIVSTTSKDKVTRCSWAESDPLLRSYHDEEWGVPEYDSRRLWEMLMLEGFQAGLSWTIILRKREAFRRAFSEFSPEVVSRFNEKDLSRLLADPGIVRSRAKIEATINGARIYLAMQAAGEDFSSFVWKVAGGKPIQNTGEIPTKTLLSEELSKAFKKRGFKFVGPVIVYAWMQAVGITNDHAIGCFRRRAVALRNLKA
jgi:DNA-3-methyladenine glycosylase I